MAGTEIEKLKMYVDHPNAVNDPRYKEFELWYYPNSHAYKKDNERLIGVSGIKSIIGSDGLAHYFKAEAIKYFRRKMIPMNDGNLVFPKTVAEFEEICKAAGTAHTAKSKRGMDTGTFIHTWLEDWAVAHQTGAAMPAMLERIPVIETKAGFELVSTEGNEDARSDSKYALDAWLYEDDKQVVLERNNLVTALESFVEWTQEHTIEVILQEKVVISVQYEYAGRFDIILRIDGKLYLVDWKTNNPSWDFPQGVFPDFFCQIGLYDVAYTEEFHWDLHQKNESPFDGHAVFNFSKQNGKFSRVFSFDTKINRSWAVHTLGTKRGYQHHVRELSLKYKENRPAPKKKVAK